MFSHAPPHYRCSFCAIIAGEEGPHLETAQADIVLRTPTTLAFIASRWWRNNPGHVLIIPTTHYENLYTLPDVLGRDLLHVTKRIAIALRTADPQCQGTSLRQHNEPVGNQDVWHFHLHLYPRYPNDNLYGAPLSDFAKAAASERSALAARLRAVLA